MNTFKPIKKEREQYADPMYPSTRFGGYQHLMCIFFVRKVGKVLLMKQ